MTLRSTVSVALAGTTASTRTSDRRPRFILPEAWVTSDVALVKLTVKGKKQQRLARIGSGIGGLEDITSAKQNSVVPGTIKRDGARTIIEPTSDLEPGEYAVFIVASSSTFPWAVRRGLSIPHSLPFNCCVRIVLDAERIGDVNRAVSVSSCSIIESA